MIAMGFLGFHIQAAGYVLRIRKMNSVMFIVLVVMFESKKNVCHCLILVLKNSEILVDRIVFTQLLDSVVGIFATLDIGVLCFCCFSFIIFLFPDILSIDHLSIFSFYFNYLNDVSYNLKSLKRLISIVSST